MRVFRNSVLREIFLPKRDEETGGWIKLNNEELNDLYFSPNIFRVIKSRRRMRWVGHVARMGGSGEVYTGFWWGNLRGKDHLEDPGVDGRIILNEPPSSGMKGHGLNWLRIRTGGELL